MALAVFAVNWRGLLTCGRADGVADRMRTLRTAVLERRTRAVISRSHFWSAARVRIMAFSSLDKERPRPMAVDDGGYTLPYTLEDSLL